MRVPDGLSPDLLVADVLARWPQTLAVFTRNRMACPGCPMGCFETLAEAASVYGLRPDRFLRELKASLTEKSPRRRNVGEGYVRAREGQSGRIHRHL